MREILNQLKGIFNGYLSKIIVAICAIMIVFNLIDGDFDTALKWLSLLIINLIIYGFTKGEREI